MNIEQFREYCLSKNGVAESFPFDESTLVFKVCDKMFALTGLNSDFWINLKCNPQKAITLREEYTAVLPGYHMNKKHWNTIKMDGSIPVDIIKTWIDDSYDLVLQKLTRKQRDSLCNG